MADFKYSAGIDVNLNVKGMNNQLKDLQKQLQQISNMKIDIGTGNLTADIEKASEAAMKLSAHLATATNPQTGNLDFTKFYTSIQKSGASLEDYGKALQNMGPAGQKAFVSLADSISKAEIPLKRTNKMVDGMWDNLKKTVGWQLSSSMVHGFIGGIQQAVGYAKDLNKSLTDIRIVTGASTDQMAQFAKEANQAAKSLSTTTTDYTRASLIYYQQGLSDAEVKARTETTIKMANATGTSAQTVSDQMTAIWNNFDNGTKSLTHYADVMTALGASTASSTDEIAEGLQKFAAISDTVGLSYEYAASALATVTATTRESADVVGNSFKTLFSRIQGLQLGETLDDGTTLNKYSTALSKVGISIKDSSGEMKNMDTILDEMGDKWGTLAKDEQMALAQTVAGVRQYTQLMALMENWDQFKQNLNVANSSAGTLDAQAAIYAESWEAASNRVRTSWEGLWDNLINSDGFIAALDVTSGLVGMLDKMVTGLGGAGGALATFGGLVTKVFNKQIASTISDVAYSIQMLKPGALNDMKEKQLDFINKAKESMSQDYVNPLYGPNESKARRDSMSSSLDASRAFLENRDHMSEEQLLLEQMFADQDRAIQQQKIDAARTLDQAHIATADSYFKLFSDAENMNKHYLKDSDFRSAEDQASWDKFIQQEVQTEKDKLIAEQMELLEQDNTPETNKRFNEIEQQIPQLEAQMRQKYTPTTYEDDLKARASKLAEINQKFNDIFKSNGSKDTIATVESLSGLIDSLGDPSNSEAIQSLGRSDFFTKLASGLQGLEFDVDDKGNKTLTADSAAYLSQQMAQLQGFSTTSMTGLADQITKKIQDSGKFTGDSNELKAQVRELAQNYLAENYAQYGFDNINMKPFNPNDMNDPRVQNMKKQETQNKAEAAVAGAQGVMQTLAAVESFKALGHELENLGNGTASLMSVLSGITSLSLNAASGFQGLHMAMSTFFTTLSPKAVTGWSVGIMGALAAVSLAFEAFDYFNTSTQEYTASIARSTQNLQNAATTTAEAFEQSQQDSETHLANVRKVESYSQDPGEMANAIYEANKQAIDMITKYGQNWVEGTDYTVDQNTGLIKIKESTLEGVQDEKEGVSEDFERTANLAQATQQIETGMKHLTDVMNNGSEGAAELVVQQYLKSFNGGLELQQWENYRDQIKANRTDEEFEKIMQNLELVANGQSILDLIAQQNSGKILQEQGYNPQDTQGYKFIQEQTSDLYKDTYLEKLNSYDDLVGGKNGWIDQMDPEAIEMAEKYLKAQGRLGVEGLKYRNGELKYYSDDTSGEQSIEWEDVKRWQAEQEAEKAITGVGEDNTSWLDNKTEELQSLYEDIGDSAEAVLNFQNSDGSLNQVSIKSLSAAYNELYDSQTKTFKSSEQVDKIQAQLGNTFEDFQQKVVDAYQPVETFNSLFKDLSNIDSDVLNMESLQNLDQNIKDFVGEDALQEAKDWLSGNWDTDTNKDGKATFEDMSTEAQNLVKYTEGIEQMLQASGLDAEGMAQAFNQIAQMDWTDDAGTNLRNIVATIGNLGGDINIADWDHLRGIMQDLSGIMPDYSGTIAQLIQIQQLLNSLKSGSTVTAEINVLLNMMGINTISDGKGGFIVTSSQEEIDAAAKSNQGEINDKVTAQRQAHSAYQNYKTTAGNNARTTTFNSYQDLEKYMSENEGASAFNDFIEDATGSNLNGDIGEVTSSEFSPWQRFMKWLGGKDSNDELAEADQIRAEEEQRILDYANSAIEAGQEGVPTEDIQSLAATYEDAAGLMEAINSKDSAFRDEDGLVDSGTLEYLQTLPETSERATAAIDAFTDAEARLQELKDSGASDDEISRAQEIADEAAAYAELQTAIDAVAAARGVDAEQLAYMVEKLREKGELPTDKDLTPEHLADYAADYIERQEAVDKLAKSFTRLDRAIQGVDGSIKDNALSEMKGLFEKLTGNVAIAEMGMQQFEKAYKRFQKDYPQGMSKILKGDVQGYKDLYKSLIKSTIAQEKNIDTNKRTDDVYDDSLEGLENYADQITQMTPQLADAISQFSPGETISQQVANSNGALQGAADTVVGHFNSLMQNIMQTVPRISEAAAAAMAAGSMGMEAHAVPMPLPEDEETVTTNDIHCEIVDHGHGHVFSEGGPVTRTVTKKGGTITQWELTPLGKQPSISPGGGGGGGGGGAPKEPKKVANKFKSQTVKRYKRNDYKKSAAEKNKQSEETRKDYLYGESKIAQMEKINKLAAKEAKINSDRIKEARDYLEEDRSNLIRYLKKYGFEAEFEADGYLANYEKAWTAVYEEIAALYQDNLLTEEEEKIEEDLNIKLEEMEAALEDYENSLNELADTIETYEELMYDIFDSKIEQIEHKVEFRAELNEDDIEYIDFMVDALGDSATRAIDKVGLISQKADNLFNNIEVVKGSIEDIFALSNDPFYAWATGGFDIDGLLTESQVEALREQRDNLQDYMEQLLEMRETIEEQVLEVFDMWTEKIDANVASLEHYSSVLEYFRGIIDLTGNDIFGLSTDFVRQMESAQIDQSMDLITTQKAYYEDLIKMNAQANAELEKARARGDEASAEHWEEVVRSTTESMESAQDAMLSALETTLNMIVDQFTAAMEDATEAFSNSIYASGGLEGLTNDYSLLKEQADLIAEDYNKIYNLSKITRNINKTLEDTNIIAGKQKLNKLLQEVNTLQASNTELSKYELEYMEAKYQLALAEVELMNAQQNKDTVSLVRDSEGNYSYIYTANENKVDEAQQKYEDALYEMQNMNHEYLAEMEESMLNTMQAMQEEIAALKISDFANSEEYMERVREIEEKYKDHLAIQEAELNKAIANNQKLYDEDWQAYSKLYDYRISHEDEWIDSFRETIAGRLLESQSLYSDFSANMDALTNDFNEDLVIAADMYFKQIEDAMNAYGTSIEQFGTEITNTYKDVQAESSNTAKATEDMVERMKNAFGDIVKEVGIWQETDGLEILDMLDKIAAELERINNAIEESANLKPEQDTDLIGQERAVQLLNEAGFGSWKFNGRGDLDVSYNGEKFNGTNFVDFNGYLINGIQDALDAYYSTPEDSPEREAAGAVLEDLFKQYWQFKNIVSRVYDVGDLEEPKKPSGFDTGGYTGEWGDEGRLAFLHEKELVLNADDTANFLTALGISRQLIEMIEMNAKASSLGLGDMVASTIKDNSQTIEQNVTITAEFPNAVDHSEIEEAFDNIINLASQYAFRRD